MKLSNLTFLTALGSGYTAFAGGEDLFSSSSSGTPITAIIGLITVVIQLILSQRQKELLKKDESNKQQSKELIDLQNQIRELKKQQNNERTPEYNDSDQRGSLSAVG